MTRLLPALACLAVAAPAAAQDPAPPAVPDRDLDRRELLDDLRDRLRERLFLRGDSVALAPFAVASRCDAGLPMPTPFGPGGAAPAPMPEVEMPEPGPVPMPNLCAGGAVAVRVLPARPAAPMRAVPRGDVRRFPPGTPVEPRFFPPPAPPPDER